MIRLPSLLQMPRSWAVRLLYGLLWLPYIAIYQLVNRFPVFEPTSLPLSIADRMIPFLPSMLPVYVCYLPFYWWTGARSEDDETLNRFFYASHFQLLVCCVVWVLFPVTMPREEFYSVASYSWADTFWRWFDAPNNCLPSLHTANCLLFARFNWNRPQRWLHVAISSTIIASTVLVKQHYVLDLFAGAIVYGLAVAFLSQVTVEATNRRSDSNRKSAVPFGEPVRGENGTSQRVG